MKSPIQFSHSESGAIPVQFNIHTDNRDLCTVSDKPSIDNFKPLIDAEVWKDIPTLPGYKASNLGRVSGSSGIKIQKLNNYGYYCINALGATHHVHRLIALTFHQNASQAPIVRHIDSCKENNKASNLAWSTYKQNVEDSIKLGTHISSQIKQGKIKPCSYKLTSHNKEQIRKDAYIMSAQTQADKYGVSKQTICNVLKKRASSW